MDNVEARHHAVSGDRRPDDWTDNHIFDRMQAFCECHVSNDDMLVDAFILKRFDQAYEMLSGAVE